MLDSYYKNLRVSFYDDENLTVMVSSNDTTFAVFAYTNKGRTDDVKALLMDYIEAAKAIKPTIFSAEEQEFSDGNVKVCGALLGFKYKDPEAITGLMEKNIFAVEAADSLRLRCRLEDLIQIEPKISLQSNSRGIIYYDAVMYKSSLDLLHNAQRKKLLPSIRKFAQFWEDTRSDIAEFSFEDNNPIIRPTKDFNERYLDDYCAIVNKIISEAKDIFDERWHVQEYIKHRLLSAIESDSLADAVDRTFRSPIESSVFAGLGTLKKREVNVVPQEDSLTVVETEDYPSEDYLEKNNVVKVEKTAPLKIKYDIKRLEKMGVDDLFFHRLLR